MNNKKTSLSNQLIVITLTALLVMIVSIIIVLPKSLEPFFEETVYSYLDQPLQMIEKEDSLTKKYKNIAYIIYSDDRILISEDYKNILGVDDYQKLLKYIVTDQGKFVYKGNNYYYSVNHKGNNYKTIAITTDSYIKFIRRNSLGIVIPIVIITFAIILILLFLWSRIVVNRLQKLKLKVDNMNNEKFYVAKSKYEFDDEIMLLDKTIDEMKEIILSQDKYKSEMYQNISHDFKTPITVIKSYIEAYHDGIEPYDEVINVSEEQIKKLENKVKTLLELNKITYLQNSYKNDIKTKIITTINSTIDKFKIVRNDINYLVKCDKEDIFYDGTPDMWESITNNILSNFVRYAKSEIVITIKENKIIFFNDGEPIEKEILSSMFEPYKKGKKGENGIGLSIVKGNCDLIVYKVIAKNKKNGVEFIINKGTK